MTDKASEICFMPAMFYEWPIQDESHGHMSTEKKEFWFGSTVTQCFVVSSLYHIWLPMVDKVRKYDLVCKLGQSATPWWPPCGVTWSTSDSDIWRTSTEPAFNKAYIILQVYPELQFLSACWGRSNHIIVNRIFLYCFTSIMGNIPRMTFTLGQSNHIKSVSLLLFLAAWQEVGQVRKWLK